MSHSTSFLNSGFKAEPSSPNKRLLCDSVGTAVCLFFATLISVSALTNSFAPVQNTPTRNNGCGKSDGSTTNLSNTHTGGTDEARNQEAGQEVSSPRLPR
eukprot:m.359063 g.359063  ORF g.359063 m.359063 type:complete len:100 (+) comp18392_c0_seq1:345-644(+)